ncbi:MAG: DUF4112 domain-containing protein [Thermodesulfobacteriota bacterium]
MSRLLYKDQYYKTSQSSRLRLIRKLSYYLDNSIGIPGTGYRVGFDAIIGLIPGLGDVVGGILSAYIVYEASRLGVPKKTLLHMTFNVALETVIGAVPIVGDVFDAAWKSNTKNIFLLDKYLNSLTARQYRK